MTENTEINDIEQIQEEGTLIPIQEEALNNESGIVEPELERIPEPWESAPDNMI